MPSRKPSLIEPLSAAESHFLQVLVSPVVLRRTHAGLSVELAFDESVPTIRRREAKTQIARAPGFGAAVKRARSLLDAFLEDPRRRRLVLDDPALPFRHANGGVLPIVRMARKEYAVMFYRDIHPVGWNIANGGSDSRDELLAPERIVTRELAEELLFVNPDRGCRLALAGVGPLPEVAAAWRAWAARGRRAWSRLPSHSLRARWLDGRDELVVRSGDDPPVCTQGVFVSVNPEDFGIEIDRVARLSVPEGTLLLDGEISRRRLINRIIGLFELGRLTRELERESRDFRPDVLFHGGRRRPGSRLAGTLDAFLEEIAWARNRDDERVYRDAAQPFDLCPVTRQLVRRTLLAPAR